MNRSLGRPSHERVVALHEGKGKGKRVRVALTALATLLAALTVLVPARAQEPAPAPAPAPVTAAEPPAATAPPPRWEYSLTPYLWGTAIKGTLGAKDRTAPIDLSLGDILSNLDFAAMINFEARKGKLSLLLDLVYANLSDDSDLPGPVFSSAEVRSQMLTTTLAGAWRVSQDQKGFADILGGLRLWSLKNTLEFRGAAAPGRNESTTTTWVDPVIGGRLRRDLSKDWSFTLAGDIGGFGVGSEFSWEVVGTFGVVLGGRNALVFGYRYLDVDYDKSGTVFDVAMQGPTLGYQFRF